MKISGAMCTKQVHFFLIFLLTFGHGTRLRIGFHYHKLGMRIRVLNWTSSKLLRYLYRLQLKGTRHLWTLPNTIRKKISIFRDMCHTNFHHFTMLQKFSKCEVKAWLCWNLIILPPLRFYVKSHLADLNGPKMSFLAILEVLNFDF